MNEKILDSLAQFEFWIDGNDFEDLYCQEGGTVDIAKHLWNKFAGYDHSILRLWSALDEGNKKIVLKVIKEWLKKIQDKKE